MPNRDPQVDAVAFDCPHCHVYAQQSWKQVHIGHTYVLNEHYHSVLVRPTLANDIVSRNAHKRQNPIHLNTGSESTSHTSTGRLENLWLSRCYACDNRALWVGSTVIFPMTRLGPPPNCDMPPEVLELYNEAQSIASLSPRAAVALIRKAVEELLQYLDGLYTHGSLDRQITKLERFGLAPELIQTMHALRLVGNDALHAGTIDFTGQDQVSGVSAAMLLDLLNIVTTQTITQWRQIREAIGTLPQEIQAKIAPHTAGNDT